MNPLGLEYAYKHHDPGGVLRNSERETPRSLARLFTLLASEALWPLDPRTILKVELRNRSVAIVARIGSAGHCRWTELEGASEEIVLKEPLHHLKVGRLNWVDWPPMFEGEIVRGIAIFALNEARNAERALGSAPASRMDFRLDRAEIEAFVGEFFVGSDLRTPARVLLGGASVGTSAEVLASFLRLPRSQVDAIRERLLGSGVFTPQGVFGRWDIPTGPVMLPLMLDAMVGAGALRRTLDADGPPRYFAIAPLADSPCEGEE